MWDRSMLGLTGSEFEIHEALRALERVLCAATLGEPEREALRTAVGILHGELDRSAPPCRSLGTLR